jgi:hypothetical protein
VVIAAEADRTWQDVACSPTSTMAVSSSTPTASCAAGWGSGRDDGIAEVEHAERDALSLQVFVSQRDGIGE